VRFEWDPAKATRNLAKQEVCFDEASGESGEGCLAGLRF